MSKLYLLLVAICFSGCYASTDTNGYVVECRCYTKISEKQSKMVASIEICGRHAEVEDCLASEPDAEGVVFLFGNAGPGLLEFSDSECSVRCSNYGVDVYSDSIETRIPLGDGEPISCDFY